MRSIIIDSNLLTLFIVGETGRANIRKHKRLNAYSSRDYDAIGRLLYPPRRIVACPHVLAETSNLLRLTPEPLATEATRALGALIALVNEDHVASNAGALNAAFPRLGLTDAILLTLAATEGALLSDDRRLCDEAAASGHPVINYNHLRDGALSWNDLPL